MIDKIISAADRGLVFVAGIAILVMLIVTTVSVIGRYLFNAPIPDDVVINELLVVVLVFLPLAYVQRTKQHVYVTLVTDRFSLQKQLFFETFGNFVGLVVFSLISYATFLDFHQAYSVLAFNEGPLELPEYPSRFAVFFGVSAMTLRLAFDVVIGIRRIANGGSLPPSIGEL
ncbi:MAG: TRAP transporter small permease [Alphaproteobacteria bacterium]|jgi:TRAP-type C4-dicarboxylate transport system permease small subunit|nr:TRAP transporter small permease [Alphaproteobacteria bacterium]MBT4964658.1 TRAP transporter small permease [Alphaproteobacteria bacterium]